MEACNVESCQEVYEIVKILKLSHESIIFVFPSSFCFLVMQSRLSGCSAQLELFPLYDACATQTVEQKIYQPHHCVYASRVDTAGMKKGSE